MGDAPDASRHERRPKDSMGLSSRHVASMVALLAATTSPYLSAARPCGDTPTYVSPVGLTCSQHASLDIGCQAFGSVGLHEDEVNDLLRNCPNACAISVTDDDCEHSMEEVDRDPASARILQSGPIGPVETCYNGCYDDPSFQTKYLLSCWNHKRLDCESFADVGFSEQEIFDLVVSCPCSCGIPCGTYTEAPSASPSSMPAEAPSAGPSSMPTDDFYRCDDPRCQDDPTYLSKLSLTCESHARFDCTSMGAIGYSEEEVGELIRRCPCSCQMACPDLFISDAPTPQPSISVNSEPSFLPSMEASSSPSSQPSSSPSSQPSVGVGWSPSSRPSTFAVGTSSGSPKAELAMKGSSAVVASISNAVSQWGQKTKRNPTKSPVTLVPTPNPSMPDIAVPSTAKPSPSPISRSPTALPTTERPSQLPTIAPIQVTEELLNQIDERAEVPVIGRIEEYPASETSMGAIPPSESENPSKALQVFATLFTLTIIGGALFVLSKKYPEQASRVGGRLYAAKERVRMILLVARGDDLADVVWKADAEDRDFGLERSDSFGSAKSNVTFAKNLVTVYEIPPSIPVRRSVSFADSFGKELATEIIGPEPAGYFDDEDFVLELGDDPIAYFDDEEFVVEIGTEKSASLDGELTTELHVVPGPRPTITTTRSLNTKVSTNRLPIQRPAAATTRNIDEKVEAGVGLGSITSLDELDDYLDSSLSTRSSADLDTESRSSGSLSWGTGSGTFDSADNTVESNPGVFLRAYYGIFSPRGQSNSWDDSI